MVATTSEYILTTRSGVGDHPDAVAEIYVKRFEPYVPYWEAGPLPVVMVHGLSVPGTVAFDLDSSVGGGHYSLARELAEAGLDVFVVELQGMGLSSRPVEMNKKVNADDAGRSKLGVTDPREYNSALFSTATDLTELNLVVDKIMTDMPRIPHGTKVQLVGYSAGATVVGPYAISHPEKVTSVVLIAPVFNPDGQYLPSFSPMVIQTKSEFTGPFDVNSPGSGFGAGAWDYEVKNGPAACDYVRDNRIVDQVWRAMYESDRSGFSWPARKIGTVDLETADWTTSSGEQVIRFRTVVRSGWNQALVSGVSSPLGDAVPALIIYGDRDKTAMHQPGEEPYQKFPPFIKNSVPALYGAIPGINKMMYKIECTGHNLLWEQQRHRVHELVAEWLHSVRKWPHSFSDVPFKNNIRGTTSGTFSVPPV